MTEVSAIGSASDAGLVSSLAGSKTMGKDEFLQLLVAQLQNQDPLNPDDPTEFVAQLAQFSSLEQQFTMNDNLLKVVESSANFERQTALGLIGKQVAGKSSSVSLGAAALGQEITAAIGFTPGELNGMLGYRLEAPATEVTLDVLDKNGKIVASLKDLDVEAGTHKMAWDSKDKNGNYLPPGDYSIKVSAKGDASGEGMAVEASPYVISTVIGVELDASGSLLETSAGRVALADVTTFMDL